MRGKGTKVHTIIRPSKTVQCKNCTRRGHIFIKDQKNMHECELGLPTAYEKDDEVVITPYMSITAHRVCKKFRRRKDG